MLTGEGRSMMAEFIAENIEFSFLIHILSEVYRLTWNFRVYKSKGIIRLGTTPKNSINPNNGMKLLYSKAFKSLT